MEKVKRIFISQPMKGRTATEIIRERYNIITALQEKIGDVEILDSIIMKKEPQNVNTGLLNLGKSLEIMSKADIAFFTKDWDKYRGCRIEHECAIEYGIDIMYDE